MMMIAREGAARPPRPRIEAGRPYPLGATWDGGGVNFALFSANAEKVDLCLFDNSGAHQTVRSVVSRRTCDRPPAPDILALERLIAAGRFQA